MPRSDNYRQAMAIERKNKNRLLAINPRLDEGSGIYILTRTDEVGIRHAYVGQAKHLLTRLSQHLSGYQHIDLSLKKYGLYAPGNINGWRVGFLHYPECRLDEMEKVYIKQYANAGYQLKNKNSGGNEGKVQIDEYRPTKGYRDGIAHGRRMLARELSHIIEKHLVVGLKEEKKNNKVSIKALEKFHDLLKDI